MTPVDKDWQPWYAWFPVILNFDREKKLAWFQNVERRKYRMKVFAPGHPLYSETTAWCYRTPTQSH